MIEELLADDDWDPTKIQGSIVKLVPMSLSSNAVIIRQGDG